MAPCSRACALRGSRTPVCPVRASPRPSGRTEPSLTWTEPSLTWTGAAGDAAGRSPRPPDNREAGSRQGVRYLPAHRKYHPSRARPISGVRRWIPELGRADVNGPFGGRRTGGVSPRRAGQCHAAFTCLGPERRALRAQRTEANPPSPTARCGQSPGLSALESGRSRPQVVQGHR